METKSCIRKRVLAVRNRMPENERLEKSGKITEKIFGLEEYQKADCILGFIGYGSEVDTIPFLEQAVLDGKKVYCPVSHESGTMEFHRFTTKEKLQAGYKNIPEPSKDAEKFEAYGNKKVFLLMPGVAFDAENHRIGYGKGFYDRFLAGYVPDFTVAVCFLCQIVDKIPAEEHDFIPDRVLTECQI